MTSNLFLRKYEKNKEKYEKIKQDKEKYEKRLARQRNVYQIIKQDKSLYANYRAKINAYLKEMRDTAREIGNCSFCFQAKESPKFRLCFKCRQYQKEYMRKRINGNRKNKYT